MLDLKSDIKKVLRPGARPVGKGIQKYSRQGRLVIEVDILHAEYKGKRWMEMDLHERQNMDDALYLSHIQQGHVLIKYT